jgi:hypothetical protein
MKQTTPEELNQHELLFRSEKQKKLFLFFLFPVLFILIFYLISKMKFDEKISKTLNEEFSRTMDMEIREEEQEHEKLPSNLKNFCYENRWSKRKCREVSELHENLQKYEKYLKLMSIDKD